MEDVLLCKSGITKCDMYEIGICDDGENICTSIEDMLLRCAKENDIQINTNVWYRGEELCDYLKSGNHSEAFRQDRKRKSHKKFST